jgi:hypothetical protein
MADSSLGDLLAGIGGHPVNRPALESFVANSQSINGLRSAQTEDALAKAQDMRDQQDAKKRVQGSLSSYFGSIGDPHPDEHATALGDLMAAHYGNDFKESEAGMKDALHNSAFSTIANPNADPNARLAADQAVNPGANPVQAVGDQLIPRFAPNTQGPGQQTPVQQTPVSQANVADKNASAALHQAQADAGGFNPNTGKMGIEHLPQEQQDAINKAVNEGRLSLQDVNSRNLSTYAQVALNNPTYDFNQAARDRSLGRNATFQQKNMIVESLPGLTAHVAELGKKLKYPDLAVAGEAKKFLMGQTNDPDLQEYMGVRNDTLLKIAGVMRSVGMSDKAHAAEEEAMSPTLSPRALDAWVKGQMSAITPLIQAQSRAVHSHSMTGGGGGPAVPTGTTPQSAPSLDDPLGIRGGK